MTAFIISEDGTMIPADSAWIIVLDDDEASSLLDDMSDRDRADYARNHGSRVR